MTDAINFEGVDLGFEADDLEIKGGGGGDYKCMKGWYTAELQSGAGVKETPKGNIIEVPFSEFATEDGEGYEEGVGGIAGREVPWTTWLTFDGDDNRARAAKGLTSLCRALGIADEVDGKFTLPSMDLTEVLEMVDGMAGSRVKFEMSPKKSGKKDDGTFFMNERVFQVAPAE